MKKLASFDIEICDELNTSDPTFVPRISCAAVALSDSEQLTFWANPNAPDMTPEIVQQMFSDLLDLASRGYTILTWNGVAFDFKVVEHYAGVYAKQVQQMSWDAHVDMMLLVAFQKGHRLGLDAALRGHQLESKLHTVKLSDGTVINDMSGAKAPELWNRGERAAVFEYLAVDVRQPLKLAAQIEEQKRLCWISKAGKFNSVRTDLLTVKDAFALLPEPFDVSWMSDPIYRRAYIEKYLPDVVI